MTPNGRRIAGLAMFNVLNIPYARLPNRYYLGFTIRFSMGIKLTPIRRY